MISGGVYSLRIIQDNSIWIIQWQDEDHGNDFTENIKKRIMDYNGIQWITMEYSVLCICRPWDWFSDTLKNMYKDINQSVNEKIKNM